MVRLSRRRAWQQGLGHEQSLRSRPASWLRPTTTCGRISGRSVNGGGLLRDRGGALFLIVGFLG